MTITSLTGINGIGPQAAKLLYSNGFKTVQSVAKASPEALSKVQGFSMIRSEKTIQSAAAMLADTKTSSPAPTPAKEKAAEAATRPAKKAKQDTADKTKRKIKKLKNQLKKKKLKKKDRKKLQKKLKKLKK